MDGREPVRSVEARRRRLLAFLFVAGLTVVVVVGGRIAGRELGTTDLGTLAAAAGAGAAMFGGLIALWDLIGSVSRRWSLDPAGPRWPPSKAFHEEFILLGLLIGLAIPFWIWR